MESKNCFHGYGAQTPLSFYRLPARETNAAPLLRVRRAMSLYEDAVATAVKLPLAQREALAQALGLKLAPRATLQMATPMARPDAKSWREAERGHAVLDVGASNAQPGPGAIRGMWAQHDLETANSFGDEATNADEVSSLPANSPVVVHTSVVTALAMNLTPTQLFWENPPVEVRLATATYLYLLEGCADASQRARVKAFVQPFAVLSLGPMASTRAAQLMLEHGDAGLSALDALIAATAIAHEIPLVTRTPRPFAGIRDLQVVTLP